LLSRNLGQLV
jgi:Reverse transcriptase (RNA-dependent DNA polymerase)